jgi:hypothetical protein
VGYDVLWLPVGLPVAGPEVLYQPSMGRHASMGQQPSFTRSVLCNAATLDSAHAALVVLAASEAEAAGWGWRRGPPA